MSSVIQGYEYDIFISYRQKDNRSDQWVTNFVMALQEEIDATFKEDISIYFDSNPHDGLHETHDVDGSLKEKVKCIVFIPIVSRTYCDPNAFAWQKEFLPFLEFAKQDEFGLDIKLQGGNVAKRVLPIRIHELAPADRKLIENEMSGPLRAIDFIYQSAGVNRPLTPKDDERDLNVHKTFYKDQLNKAANAIHDIISTMQLGDEVSHESVVSEAKPQATPEKVSVKPKRRIKVKLSSLSQSGRLRLINVVLLIVIAVLALLYISLFRKSDKQSFSASILPPEKLEFTSDFAISPDGKSLAYVTRDSLGNMIMWVRPLEALSGQALPGTEGADYPFWSPNSKFIGFFADGKVKKVSASGGPVLTLCETGIARGGSWSKEGIIIFGAIGLPLSKVKDTGGIPQRMMRLDSVRNELSQRWPHFLPDGQQFLYTSQVSNYQEHAIFLASLDTTFAPRLLTYAPSSGHYADGHLLLGSQETLMAQPFDIRSGQLFEEAFPVASSLDILEGLQYASFSVSTNGIIVYQQSIEQASYFLNWYDRQGKKLKNIALSESEFALEVALSPDAKKVAVSKLTNGFFDIWVYEVERSVWNRFTFDEGDERWPAWSADGNTIMYSSNRNGKGWDLYQREASGAGNEDTVISSPVDLTMLSWSQDGKYLAYTQRQQGNYDIWIKPANVNYEDSARHEKPFILLESEFEEIHPSLSPDSRWIAYQSNESGRFEIYLRHIPDLGGKRQVSVNGGTRPRWRADGKELYYLGFDNTFFAQEMELNSTSVLLSQPEPLFNIINLAGGPYAHPYDVISDGKQFVISEANEVGSSQPLVLIVNWLEKGKREEN